MKLSENREINKPIVVDVRGFLCPHPVIETKKVADAHPDSIIETIVDNEVSRDNVEKFGQSRGAQTFIKQEGKDFYITLVPSNQEKPDESYLFQDLAPKKEGQKVILMTKDYLGEGSEELGRTLMKTFWVCLAEADHKPKAIYFINSSVKMVAQGSPHLESLKSLVEQGVDIAACGICLDYYGLKEQLALGTITNLYAITDAIVGEDLVKL